MATRGLGVAYDDELATATKLILRASIGRNSYLQF